MNESLFSLPSDAYKVTSDDCYTPRWVVDAMGLEFDLDVAAPPGGPWHVPAKAYYTAEDDGLAQPWEGLVWCNPPYSAFEAWADKWIAHDRGVLLGYQLPQVRWTRKVFAYTPFTPLFNATGQPAISLPLARSTGGLPIGIQFAGRFGAEDVLLNLAAQLERHTPWPQVSPLAQQAATGDTLRAGAAN